MGTDDECPTIHPRISRGDLFMKLAHDFSLRGTCPRASVGCVIVVGKHPVAFGYNGAPPGQDHCSEVGCDLVLGPEAGCQRIVHAEANAVAHAARLGIQVRNGICFCTHSPCRKCAQLLATAGIKQIVYYHPYRATPWTLLEELEIPTVHLHKYEEEQDDREVTSSNGGLSGQSLTREGGGPFTSIDLPGK